MIAEQEYGVQLGRIKNLPPLPEISLRIVNTVNDPDVSVNDVVEVLSLSPSLVARLLGLANSAYFGYPGKISDLRKAIIQVLGLNLVKSLSLSIALNVQLDSRKCQAFDAHYYWIQALTAAVLAQKISAKSSDRLFQPAAVYTSGLLLNIGILAGVYLFPEKMQEILERCQQSGSSVKAEIHTAIGLTHYQLGYLLLNRWRLPLLYQVVAKEFGNPTYRGEERSLIVLHRISQNLSSSISKGKPADIGQFQTELDLLSVEAAHVLLATEQVAASVNDIQELAAIICGS